MRSFLAVTLVAVVAMVAAPAALGATVRVGPQQTKTIRGDVLWMRIVSDRELLAPFALDFKGRQCWAPPSVNEEDCTMLVSRRINGRRTLINGSGVSVSVHYASRF